MQRMRALFATFALALLPAMCGAVDSVADRAALADLYQAMGGAHWTRNANWLASNVSMCSWYGVVCAPGNCQSVSGTSVECRVAELNLAANGLIGPIASAVQRLTNLTRLVLGGNALGGTIPSLSALTSLERLDLNTAQLTGSIPEFETLANLRHIYLHQNLLAGPVPAFASHVLLQNLSLYSNNLTGTVPSFDSLVQLQILYLRNNRLSGTIPEFTEHSQLKELYLNSNELSGTVPSFVRLLRLRILALRRNNLTGTVPSFDSLAQLQQLGLSNNRLSGTVPSFDKLVQLQSLSLFSNQLSSTLPAFSNLTKLQSLYLDDNLLAGTVPEFTKLVQLENLHLNNNRLVGTVPSFSTLAKLKALILSSNSLSGTMPNFESTTVLQQLDLGNNRLSGTLAPLGALTQLTVLRVGQNRLTGSLPSSWRTLRSLALVDASDNTLDGQILLFQPSALPPLSAVFVNLSFNRIGGQFIALPPPDAINLTSIDIRRNQFLCPYPLFDLSLRVLRFECENDWAQLGAYAGIAIAVAAVGIATFLVIKRIVSEQRVRIAMFLLSWFASAVSLLSDAYSYTVIVQFLQKRSQNCASVNEVRVFFPQIYNGAELPLSLQGVAGSYLFSDWIKPQAWSEANSLDFLPLFIDAFSSACRQAPECAYNDDLKQCYIARPDLSTSGGGAHQAFLSAVFTFIALRAAYELFCLIVIAVSCARDSLILSCRVWIKSSVFLPILLIRTSTRSSLYSDVVLATTPPSEYIWELLTSGVFVTGLKLYAQTYYLLQVADTGLEVSNWLSLALSIVTVVRLVAQAVWSWRKMQKGSVIEDHHAQRVESGADFDLDDLGGGGNVDMHKYTLM